MATRPPVRPALRRLDVHPADHEGRSGVALVDPIGLSEEQAFVPEGLLPILARMDGSRTIAEIEAELRGAGVPLPDGLVANVVRQLDEHLLLASDRFQAVLRRAVDEFLAAPARPARHAGSAGYPADPDALRRELERLVPRPASTPGFPTPAGLVAPHIDLHRGREGYARAYGHLAACEPADLYVVFGTGHQGPSAPVTGLMLDWETPLGTVRTDRDVVAAVHRRIGEPNPEDVFLHAHEHSIEFQVLMLAHVLGEREFAVAGFLTGALPSTGGDPLQEPYLQRILEAFREATAGRRVCFVAGADLAHVGPYFGDEEPVSDATLARLERADRERLAALEAGRPGAFHIAVERDDNPDRICGASPMLLAAALAGGEARLLHYGQALAPDRSQVVTFCSMVLDGSGTDSTPTA